MKESDDWLNGVSGESEHPTSVFGCEYGEDTFIHEDQKKASARQELMKERSWAWWIPLGLEFSMIT